MVKNLVLWVVVAIVMMTAYQSFNSNGVSDSTDYTTFVYDVSNSQVKEARFDANEITVTKNDGSKYMTVMPPLEDKKQFIITNFNFVVPNVIPCRGMDFLHASNARWWRESYELR